MTLTELKKKNNVFVCYFPSFLRNFSHHRCPPSSLKLNTKLFIHSTGLFYIGGSVWLEKLNWLLKERKKLLQ
ncbi:hypothetical protein BpHYR1_049283 [Brachionus plicatilis]|uniref:Uncharacterized protein n=1 Tax=Brachionus plicatilis TaxID=10195 RepID=A0A3M7SSB0_BRAPC|nr:hypothetical protein BpHYR1_049283 [Brachionus plicatilis]